MMRLCVSLLSVASLAFAFLSGEIEIRNHPKGVVWCGQSINLNFTYKSSDVPDGTTLNVLLKREITGQSNKLITQLGSVVAPAKEFLVQFAEPFPAEWIGKDKLENNAGTGTQATIEIERADKSDVSSYCTLCVDPEFTFKCCPASDAAKCGCDKCSCSTGDKCNAGLQCASGGKCAIDLPGNGEKCLNGMCESNFDCKCPQGMATCQETDKTCVDSRTCPVNMQALPGKLNCPCSNPGMMCEGGLACVQYTCRASSSTPIGMQPCTPAVSVQNTDACMTHPAGTAPQPHSCQTGRCAPCTPGSTLCTCNNGGACSASTDQCQTFLVNGAQQQRCFPRIGCIGCPCYPDNNRCDEGICISSVCTRPNTPPPVPQTPAPPVPPAGPNCTMKPGSAGCDCLKQGTQVGCGEQGLVCNKSKNKCEKPGGASHASQLVLSASVMISFALAFFF